jgi:hypothetical protein
LSQLIFDRGLNITHWPSQHEDDSVVKA